MKKLVNKIENYKSWESGFPVNLDHTSFFNYAEFKRSNYPRRKYSIRTKIQMIKFSLYILPLCIKIVSYLLQTQ